MLFLVNLKGGALATPQFHGITASITEKLSRKEEADFYHFRGFSWSTAEQTKITEAAAASTLCHKFNGHYIKK